MEETKVYFNSLIEANEFVNYLNSILGIPISDDAVTKNYTEPIEEDGRYYVAHNLSL